MPFRRYLFVSVLTLCTLLLTWLTGLAASANTHPLRQSSPQPPSPSPTYDPLAIPTLPANPTQFDLGQNLYFYHCMPCHGDVGQGLTDAFRMIWEDDHQNCWARGCHGGRPKDEGFPVPTIVPAIISPAGGLAKFPDLESLVAYLHDTHPPQRPGKLDDGEYRSLAIFLWVSNRRPLSAVSDAPPSPQPSFVPTDILPDSSPTPTHPAIPTASPPPVATTPPVPAVIGDLPSAGWFTRIPVLMLFFLAFLLSAALVLIILKLFHRLDRP
jgi:hypothetical protein